MGVIALEGMHFHAKHGFYPEEKVVGGEFIVDVYIETNFGKAAEGDDLFQTINYETIFWICQKEMKEPSKILENVLKRIIAGLQYQFSSARGARVCVTKLNTSLSGRVDRVTVEEKRNF